MSIKCFLIEPTGRQRVYLRRYHSSSDVSRGCPGNKSYHNAMVDIGEAVEKRTILHGRECLSAPPLKDYLDDPRWPAKCDHCGYHFEPGNPNDLDQVFTKAIYRRADTGAELVLDEAPPGAMWNAWWMADFNHGPDGQCLVVVCPDGAHWTIDGRASNCDSPCENCGRAYHLHQSQRGPCANCQRPYENCRGTCSAGYSDSLCVRGYKDARPHKCWVRQGVPPLLTVGKAGVTCGAGAGSIQTAKWHGFLRDGQLVEA